jgi:hypothetical protein
MNEWQKRFGKARAASDKALLQEVERSIPDGRCTPSGAYIEEGLKMIERDRIARAFGRPPLFAKPPKRS